MRSLVPSIQSSQEGRFCRRPTPTYLLLHMCYSWHVPTTVSALLPAPKASHDPYQMGTPTPVLDFLSSSSLFLRGRGERSTPSKEIPTYMPSQKQILILGTFLFVYARLQWGGGGRGGLYCLQKFQIQVTPNLSRKKTEYFNVIL